MRTIQKWCFNKNYCIILHLYQNKSQMSSVQKRKNPLTTIAISQEYASKIDEYTKEFAMTRKDFVELAIDYFQRTGFDIRSEAFDLSPLEKITQKLESALFTLENKSNESSILSNILQAINDQSKKQISSTQEKEKLEVSISNKDLTIDELRKENNLLKLYKENSQNYYE